MSIRATVPRARGPSGSRPEPADRSPERLRAIAVAATTTTFLLIAVGGLVRATESGLGCSGWPKCTPDRWLPPLEYHALIEYSHRFLAFLDILLVVALVVVVWRWYSRVHRLTVAATSALVLIFFQAALGGIVVKGELHALLVSAHLATAMVFAGVLVYVSVVSFTLERTTGPPDGLTRLAWLAAGGTLALVAVGAYVRGEGAGLVFTDWPLMDGRLVPVIASAPAGIHFAHRVLALVIGLIVTVVAVTARRERRKEDPVVVLSAVAALLFLAQVVIGAANVWSKLTAPAVVAHVAVAGLAWGAVVATAATAAPAASAAHQPMSVRGGP